MFGILPGRLKCQEKEVKNICKRAFTVIWMVKTKLLKVRWLESERVVHKAMEYKVEVCKKRQKHNRMSILKERSSKGRIQQRIRSLKFWFWEVLLRVVACDMTIAIVNFKDFFRKGSHGCSWWGHVASDRHLTILSKPKLFKQRI